ncbi:hypothetical protein EZV62_007658 [Acer yangbiense]|uniref:Uncharacterized protein n=1 Tax=Acer yangbiense TaxID=1000413 RepID=A0A5C7IA60_9ROSI|nr:hypothetical protein EZV62_007658 [Acer yangbiense]
MSFMAIGCSDRQLQIQVWSDSMAHASTNLCDFLIISPSNTTTHHRQLMLPGIHGGDNPTEARQVAQLPSALLQYTFEYCYLLESAGALLIVTRQGMTARPLTDSGPKY